tara:strand:- start:135 stop:353 length:219 start_codon:yes stop_codon:yes gene_type:complete
MSDWDHIQKLIDQICSSTFRDRHVSIQINAHTMASGQIYIDFGAFGNATQTDTTNAINFLSGVLMGMCINRG